MPPYFVDKNSEIFMEKHRKVFLQKGLKQKELKKTKEVNEMRIEGSMDAFTIPSLSPQAVNEKGHSAPSGERIKKMSEQATKDQERRKLTEEEVFKQAQDANQQLKAYDRRLEFSVHDETHKIMVKVINTNDDSVIREIPSEKALDMLAYVWKMTGILLDEKR